MPASREPFVPSPPAAPVDLIAALAEALRSVGARWYLFGAQAALIWGRPRLTADVDVTVRLEPEDPDALVRAFAQRGFRLRVDTGDDFVRRTRVLPFVFVPNGLPVDVVLAGPGLEELFLSRAVQVRIGGTAVPVISPEDLIVTKVLAGRPKDLEDVRGILIERLGQLDLAAIRSTLASVEAALGQSDLQPAFEAELARAQR
jgi:hypothetical protein